MGVISQRVGDGTYVNAAAPQLLGEPMEFRGNPNDEDQVIEEKVEQVKAKIRSMIEAGLRRRRSVFF